MMKETENEFKKGVPELLGFNCYDQNGKFTHFIPNKLNDMEQIELNKKINEAISGFGSEFWEYEYHQAVIESSNECEKIAQEYAQQQSIEFAKWCAKNSDRYEWGEDLWHYNPHPGHKYSTKIMYDLFLNSKTETI